MEYFNSKYTGEQIDAKIEEVDVHSEQLETIEGEIVDLKAFKKEVEGKQYIPSGSINRANGVVGLNENLKISASYIPDKFITTDNIDTELSDDSVNPVQNKVITDCFKRNKILNKVEGKAVRIDCASVENGIKITTTTQNELSYLGGTFEETQNGVSFKLLEDGTIILNGENNSENEFIFDVLGAVGGFSLDEQRRLHYGNIDPNSYYFVCSGFEATKNIGASPYFIVYDKDNGGMYKSILSENGNGFFEVNTSAQYIFGIRIHKSAKFDNLEIHPKLSTPNKLIKYGKNLINPYDYIQEGYVYTDSGVTFEVLADGGIKITGKNETMFQMDVKLSIGEVLYFQQDIAFNISGKFVETDVLGVVTIVIPYGVEVDEIVYPQVELGNDVTQYEKFIAPIAIDTDASGEVSQEKVVQHFSYDTATLFNDNNNSNITCVYSTDISYMMSLKANKDGSNAYGEWDIDIKGTSEQTKKDSQGQDIPHTYVKNVSLENSDLVITKGDGGTKKIGLSLPESGSSIEVDGYLDKESENPVQNKVLAELLEKMESIDNKVTSLDMYSNDTQYPSAKTVYNLFDRLNRNKMDLVVGYEEEIDTYKPYGIELYRVADIYRQIPSEGFDEYFLFVCQNYKEYPDMIDTTTGMPINVQPDYTQYKLKYDGFYRRYYYDWNKSWTAWEKTVFSDAFNILEQTVKKSATDGLKYYGDAGVIPSPVEWFTFEIDTTNDTATITGFSDVWRELNDENKHDIIIPYKYMSYLVTEIGSWAFGNVGGDITIYSIKFPNTITKICDYAFLSQTEIRKVLIPGSVKTIDTHAFYSSAKTVILEDGVETFGDYAFFTLGETTTIYAPKSLAEIGELIDYPTGTRCNLICPAGSYIAEQYKGSDYGNVIYDEISEDELSKRIVVDEGLDDYSENPVQNKVVTAWINNILSQIDSIPNITVDDALDSDSTNPVQNKVVAGALDDKIDINRANISMENNQDPSSFEMWGINIIGNANTASVANTALFAESAGSANSAGVAESANNDGLGNNIADTYLRKESVDDALDSDSTNPVQNKVVAGALNELSTEATDSVHHFTIDNDILKAQRSDYSIIEEVTLPTGVTGIWALKSDGKENVYNILCSTQKIPSETLVDSITGESINFATPSYVDNAIGDIETALDNIIAIQNTLIGGSNV